MRTIPVTRVNINAFVRNAAIRNTKNVPAVRQPAQRARFAKYAAANTPLLQVTIWENGYRKKLPPIPQSGLK